MINIIFTFLIISYLILIQNIENISFISITNGIYTLSSNFFSYKITYHFQDANIIVSNLGISIPLPYLSLTIYHNYPHFFISPSYIISNITHILLLLSLISQWFLLSLNNIIFLFSSFFFIHYIYKNCSGHNHIYYLSSSPYYIYHYNYLLLLYFISSHHTRNNTHPPYPYYYFL